MKLLRQVHLGRLALLVVVFGLLAVLIHLTDRSGSATNAGPTPKPAAPLKSAAAKHNPYGLPYRTTAAAKQSGGVTDADAVYFPTEKGRHVVCLVHGLSYYSAVMSCDWVGYHARYGPGDPFDQR